MKVTWVIERHIFEEEQELALIAEVKKQGGLFKLIDPLAKHNFPWETHGWELENEPVVFRGSLNIGVKARQQAWYPGVIMDKRNFNCSTYYTYWGQWVLNKNYWMMPLAELLRKVDFIKEYLQEFTDWYSDKAFIRPDSGLKQFTGGVFNLSDLRSLNGIKSETLVVIAPVKQIDREYRFVVCDNKVITGSQYFEKGEYVSKQKATFNEEAAYYLECVLENINWLPDQIYTVDVCESESEFNILELNSFSCSNLYHCDLSKVVEAANEVAISEWQQVND
jgi:hypothetical protein